MLQVNFKPLQGNTAVIKTASEIESKHASELAGSIISSLQNIAVLNDDEKGLLDFVKSINPNLTNKFAGCGDDKKALTMFSQVAIIGEKRIYSVATAPKSLDDLLMNLASTRTLYRAVKVETKKTDKLADSLTFTEYCKRNNVNDALLAIARDVLVTNWFNQLRTAQVSEGKIRDLCEASSIEYQLPTSEASE